MRLWLLCGAALCHNHVLCVAVAVEWLVCLGSNQLCLELDGAVDSCTTATKLPRRTLQAPKATFSAGSLLLAVTMSRRPLRGEYIETVSSTSFPESSRPPLNPIAPRRTRATRCPGRPPSSAPRTSCSAENQSSSRRPWCAATLYDPNPRLPRARAPPRTTRPSPWAGTAS